MDILHLDMTYRQDNAREKNNRYIKMLSYLTLQKNIILFSSNATYMYYTKLVWIAKDSILDLSIIDLD